MTYLLTQVAHGSDERGAWDGDTQCQEERRTQVVRGARRPSDMAYHLLAFTIEASQTAKLTPESIHKSA